MIEKLRRKFIWVNMGLVTAVLLVVFGAICLTNYQQLREETNRALERMLMAPMGMAMDKPQIGLPQRAPGCLLYTSRCAADRYRKRTSLL